MSLSLKNNSVLKFNANTLQEVRREYGLDQQGIERAIDILQEWIQKQGHFVKKDFDRDYLERVIISTKGSLEKAKIRVDKICTMRTMAPELFEKCHAKDDFPTIAESYINVNMPQLTEDNCRVYIMQMKGDVTSSKLMEAYQLTVILSEYMKLKDYSGGSHVIVDLMNVNIMNLVTNINLFSFQNIIILLFAGYGFRVKGIYILSPSKMIDSLISLLKQVLSAKVGQRIRVLKTVDCLLECFPKHLLPKDFGGEGESISDINDKWMEALSSEEHVSYIKEIRKACTNESLRRPDKFDDGYLGIPGSFKSLNVD